MLGFRDIFGIKVRDLGIDPGVPLMPGWVSKRNLKNPNSANRFNDLKY